MSVKKRSERGKGSLFFDSERERWVVMTSLPKTVDGKRRRSKRTFLTKVDAMSFLTEGCAQQLEQIQQTFKVIAFAFAAVPFACTAANFL